MALSTRQTKYLLSITVFAIVCGAATDPSQAQSHEETATAIKLFEDGRSLMERGRHERARDKFEASLALVKNAATAMNLAVCYRQLKKTASAWSLFQDAARLARESGRGQLAADAQQAARELEGTLSRLVIDARALARLTDPADIAEVTRNDRRVDPALFGKVIYVDPGRHVIKVVARGYRSQTHRVVVATGARRTVVIGELVQEALKERAGGEDDARSATGQPARMAPAPTPVHSARRTLGAVAMSAGTSALIVGLGFGWSSDHTRDQAFASGLCRAETLQCSAAGQVAMDSAHRHALLANALVGAGALLLGTGLALYLSARSGASRDRRRASAEKPPAASWVPLARPNGLGLAVVGRF